MAITVAYHANTRQIDGTTGRTVGQIRSVFGPIFGLPKNATATLNGRRASDSERPKDGDTVAFR